MIQITPQMRILVAVDGRKGIDSLARLCQEKLQADPFSGCLFVFRSRRGTAICILVYDGQGFCLAQKRLSKGIFAGGRRAAVPGKWPESGGTSTASVVGGGRPERYPGSAGVAAGERGGVRKHGVGAYVLIPSLLRCGAWKGSSATGAG